MTQKLSPLAPRTHLSTPETSITTEGIEHYD